MILMVPAFSLGYLMFHTKLKTLPWFSKEMNQVVAFTFKQFPVFLEVQVGLNNGSLHSNYLFKSFKIAAMSFIKK